MRLTDSEMASLTTELLNLSLRALSTRALLWFITIGALVTWGVAAALPTPLRLIAAAGYCVTVFLPALISSNRPDRG